VKSEEKERAYLLYRPLNLFVLAAYNQHIKGETKKYK
jgi:hypothetical protein